MNEPPPPSSTVDEAIRAGFRPIDGLSAELQRRVAAIVAAHRAKSGAQIGACRPGTYCPPIPSPEGPVYLLCNANGQCSTEGAVLGPPAR